MRGKIHKALLESLVPYDVGSLLARRLVNHFDLGVLTESTRVVLLNYKLSLWHFKPCIVVAHVRALLNHWCTSRRFGMAQLSCPFGCGSDDSLAHVLTCDCFQEHYNTEHPSAVSLG